MLDEPDVLQRAQSGDSAAFDTLIEPSLPKVRGVIWLLTYNLALFGYVVLSKACPLVLSCHVCQRLARDA